MPLSVIKIKPPVCFSLEHANILLSALRAILAEDLTDQARQELLRMDLEYNAKIKEEKRREKAGRVALSQGQAMAVAGACAAAAVLAALVVFPRKTTTT